MVFNGDVMKTSEWGIFNDEGLIEGGFYTREEAVSSANTTYGPEDEVAIYEICPEPSHDEPRHCCEQCHGEE